MRKLFASMMIFSTSFCFTTIQVKVNDLNTNEKTFLVEVDLSQSSDGLKQPFQVVYNGSTEFYNNHSNDNKLLPIYLYTQENSIRDIVLKSGNGSLIAYASTTELNFFTLPQTNGILIQDSTRSLSNTPGWSQLRSRDKKNRVGVPSVVNVTYTYDSQENKITFYFPSIYAESFPPNVPNILSTYTEYFQKGKLVDVDF